MHLSAIVALIGLLSLASTAPLPGSVERSPEQKARAIRFALSTVGAAATLVFNGKPDEELAHFQEGVILAMDFSKSTEERKKIFLEQFPEEPEETFDQIDKLYGGTLRQIFQEMVKDKTTADQQLQRAVITITGREYIKGSIAEKAELIDKVVEEVKQYF